MNLIYTINYAIFSIFITLFIIEVGFAISLLIDYDSYSKKIRPLINPIWEVTGTFAVFFVVNYEVSYPKILVIVGNAYVLPILASVLFIILRNSFLVLGDYQKDKTGRAFSAIYSISTLIVAILAVSVLTSAISGIGISNSGMVNIGFMLNSFNIIMLIAIIALSISLATSLIDYRGHNALGPVALLLGFAIAFLDLYTYLPKFRGALGANIPMIGLSVILLATSMLLQFKKTRYASVFSILSIVVFVNILGAIIYPYIFGSQNINNYIASSAISGPAVWITLIGGILVAISLSLLVYFNYIKKIPQKGNRKGVV